jgi:protein TonB
MSSVRLEESMIFTRVVSDELSERAGARAPRHVWHRARSLPALGMPADRRRRRLASALSVVIHVFAIWLLLRPEALKNLNPDLVLAPDGLKGNGIAGGGGGGTRGTGGVKFVTVAPPAQPVPPPETKPILPPLQPVVEPPKPVIPEPALPQLELPKPTTTEAKAEVHVQSPIIGTGGGIGNDGTRGNGPGSGGGIGNGVGTGTGSGNGPGTGSGTGDIACRSTEMPIFPLPAPANVKGFKLKVNFDVDATGKVLKWEFTPTKNGDYNRRINETLKGFRFMPPTNAQGVPVRGLCPFTWEF